MTWKIITSYLSFLFRLIFPAVRKKIAEIVTSKLTELEKTPKKKLFVLLVGFSHAGKTTLRKNNQQTSSCFTIETNLIHDQLNKNLEFLRDDKTINGSRYWLRQFFTRLLRKKILTVAFSSGRAILDDSCNLRRIDRYFKLQSARKAGYKTVIVWVHCPKKELLARLKRADLHNIKKRKTPAWYDLYKMQKKHAEKPSPKEADRLIVYNGKINQPEDLHLF
jgi:predicted kinase